MAKVVGPLFSLDAHRSLGKTITVQRRPSGHAIIKPPRPSQTSLKNPSASQQTQRDLIASWVASWQALQPAERKYWSWLAEKHGLDMSGYNYFMKSKSASLLLEDGLVLYLPFSMGSGCTAADYSGYKNNGVLKPDCPTSSPDWVAGKGKEVSSALDFNGSTDYVSCGNKLALDINCAFTLEAWIKLESLGVNCDIISKGTGNTTNYCLRVQTTKKLDFFVYDTGGNYHGIVNAPGDALVEVDEWYHIVATYDGIIFKIYVNGVQNVYTSSWSGDIKMNTANLHISLRTYYFNGLIDEVKVYRRALTQTEIIASYNNLK